MDALKKMMIGFLVTLCSSGYASAQLSPDLERMADMTIKRYQASQKLQKMVENSVHHLSAQWIEIFDEKGFIIAHSHPSRIYKHKPLMQPHYNAVITVLHSGHALEQKGSDNIYEEFYPIKFHRKTIGVIEIIREHM